MKKSVLCLIGLLTLQGCGRRTLLPQYGVESFELRMNEEWVGEVLRGAPLRIEYPATLRYAGKNYSVRIEPAGASSIRDSRKNWDVKFTDRNNPFQSEEIRLAAMNHDESMLRTSLSIDVFKAAGFPTVTAVPVFVHLNELVFGLYYRMEKINPEFFDRRGIKWRRIYSIESQADFKPDMVNRLNVSFKGLPEPANLEVMAELTRLAHVNREAEFEERVFQILHREDVINYLAASLIASHSDGFIKNLFFYQPTGDAKLRLIPWDFDIDWADSARDPWRVSDLFNRMANLSSVQSEVNTRVSSLIAGNASYATLSAALRQYQTLIRSAYSADPYRQIKGSSLDRESNTLDQFINNRISTL